MSLKSPLSNVIRKQTALFPLLADADVVLERRDPEDVVLMRDERYRAMEGALRIAARSLALVAKANREMAEEVFAEELPWLKWLPVEHRPAAVTEPTGFETYLGLESGASQLFSTNPWTTPGLLQVRMSGRATALSE